MAYEVLARKWRPQVFQDVIGQEHITQTLINAINTERFAHAYLFSGARGVGKTSVARILARRQTADREAKVILATVVSPVLISQMVHPWMSRKLTGHQIAVLTR